MRRESPIHRGDNSDSRDRYSPTLPRRRVRAICGCDRGSATQRRGASFQGPRDAISALIGGTLLQAQADWPVRASSLLERQPIGPDISAPPPRESPLRKRGSAAVTPGRGSGAPARSAEFPGTRAPPRTPTLSSSQRPNNARAPFARHESPGLFSRREDLSPARDQRAASRQLRAPIAYLAIAARTSRRMRRPVSSGRSERHNREEMGDGSHSARPPPYQRRLIAGSPRKGTLVPRQRGRPARHAA